MAHERETTRLGIPPPLRPFWEAFTRAIGHDPSERFYEAFHFDDHQESADHLAALVLAGTKRATAGLLWTYEADAKPLARPGDLSVVTLFSGQPVCIIETKRVQTVPFSEVTAEFAAIEGEGDGSLAFWRRVHTAYFGRECRRLGREPHPEMPVVCETFEVVYRGAEGPDYPTPPA